MQTSRSDSEQPDRRRRGTQELVGEQSRARGKDECSTAAAADAATMTTMTTAAAAANTTTANVKNRGTHTYGTFIINCRFGKEIYMFMKMQKIRWWLLPVEQVEQLGTKPKIGQRCTSRYITSHLPVTLYRTK